MNAEDVRSLDGAVGELWRDGSHHGWIACQVEAFRGLRQPFRSQLRVWIRCTYPDGRFEPDEEDYPPYYSVPELLEERWTDANEVAYQVRWYDGDARDAAWERHGLTDGPRP